MNKNEKTRHFAFLLLYTVNNATATAFFIHTMLAVIKRRDWDFFHEVTPALMLFWIAMWITANKAKYHYTQMYKNNQR